MLAGCATALRPGGYLTVTTESTPGAGRDPGAETVARCAHLGLRYWQHVICLLVPIDNGALRPVHRPDRSADVTVVHRDLHVFRKPPAAAEQRSTQARGAA